MFSNTPPWQDVLDYWFGNGLQRGWPEPPRDALWFAGGAAADAEIERRFGSLVEAALSKELVDWESQPFPRLALLILLDQFTRNIHRGTARAFAGDHRAVTLVNEGLALGMDRKLPWVGRVFFYMPLMHAEDLALQQKCIKCFAGLVDEAPPEVAGHMRTNLAYAREHAEVIERFGRFPHRNEALLRESTPEEIDYLRDANRYGQ
ncbi:DUF924 family protein [Alcanivorax quisquiliarum]|uniref:DUF924 domain-containing protein n=1 Tax=Alcanivorax quisquiliarum TaxID=2933565 RepID=A0ABT0E456_9GAMM|nr:DUF924 family protein [Alcanivorax quisquiliarum]MCK0536605.1 DUF924 domain-containing protein [Alcanivorax quisquiliarum]